MRVDGGVDVPALGVEIDRSLETSIAPLVVLVGWAVVEQVFEDGILDSLEKLNLLFKTDHSCSLRLEIREALFKLGAESSVELLLDELLQF
jgi:hypothetical protein